MNMISELRQRVRNNGKAEITPEEFDRLQAEWITRTGAEDLVLAEREACAKVCERIGGKMTDDCYGAQTGFWPDQVAHRCVTEIMMRSNV